MNSSVSMMRLVARRIGPVVIAAAVLLMVFWLWPRPRSGPSTTSTTREANAALPPWSAADEAEMRRLNKLGYFAGDTVEVFLIGTLSGALDTLPRLIKDLQRDAVVGGAGTRAIYPDLPGDGVYVLAGPHRADGYDLDPLAMNHAARVRFASRPRRVRLVMRDGDPPPAGQPSRVAQAEFRRLWYEGKLDWPEFPVRVVATFPETELARAAELLRRIGIASVETGLADHTVYPDVAPGTLIIFVGPYQPERMAWAARRIPRMERAAGRTFYPRTLRVRDVRELGGWTPVDSTVPPLPPMGHYPWMDED